MDSITGRRTSGRVDCALFSGGHQIHWIQPGKANETPSIPLTFVSLRGAWLATLDPDGNPMNFAHHDPLRLDHAMETTGGEDLRLHGYDVLKIGSSTFSLVRGRRVPGKCHARPTDRRRREDP